MAYVDFRPQNPNSIKLPYVGESISEGDELECEAGQNGSPSEFYLTPAAGFPRNLNIFIRDMTMNYRSWTTFSRNFPFQFPKLKPDATELQPGSIVACFNRKITHHYEDETVRAKVIRKIEEPPENQEGDFYWVLMVDLGGYTAVDLQDMFYLHEGFISTNCWGIKCRFILDRYCSAYENGEEDDENANVKWKWPKETLDVMNDVFDDRSLEVRFVRRVKKEDPNVGNEDIWEVSILSVTPDDHWAIDESGSVDEQILERTIGASGYFRLLNKEVDTDKGGRFC